jgi:hypothetical protein
MGDYLDPDRRLVRRGGLPVGTANGEPMVIPGYTPDIALRGRMGNLPPGTANGEPQVIPGLSQDAAARVIVRRVAENAAPQVAPPQPVQRQGNGPIPPHAFDDARAVATLNELLGGGDLGVGIGGLDRAPENFNENMFPENGPIQPHVFPQMPRREEPQAAPPMPVQQQGAMPPQQQGVWPNIENMDQQGWNNLQHVQDVLGEMRAADANKFRFREPAEVMRDPKFQQFENMDDDERFLRNALKDQIRNQTLPQRQAALHGLIPHQFSGFGGANDGSSADFYRNVPRTKANPDVVKASLLGADAKNFDSLRAMINNDKEQAMADDPARKMEGLIVGGKTPEEAVEILDKVDQFAAGRAQRQQRNPVGMLNNALGGGGIQQGGQFGEMPVESGADTRKAAEDAIKKLASTSTLEELLGNKAPKQFDQSDLAQAYDQWSNNKLNEKDLIAIVEFLKAMEAAGTPVEVPHGWFWDSAKTTGLRDWLNTLKSGTLNRPQLQGAYQGGFDRVNKPIEARREQAIRGMADSINMGGW